MKLFDAVAEMQIIKTVCDIKDPSQRAKILSRLTVSHFGNEDAGKIFGRIKILIQNSKDIPSSKVLAIDNTLPDTAKALISNPSYKGLETNVDINTSLDLIDTYYKNRILFTAMSGSFNAFKEDNPDFDAIAANLSDTLQKCAKSIDTNEMEHYTQASSVDLCKSIMDDLIEKSPMDFLPTGWEVFDRKTGGLRRKNVLVIASVPGGGKSTMALQMAMHQYSTGFNVCYISFEMDNIEVRYRMLSAISQIDHSDINLKRLNKEQLDHIQESFKKFLMDTPSNGANTFTVYCPREEKTIGDLVADIQHHNYDCVYIDYISLLKSEGKKQLWEILGDHAKKAKMAGNKLNASMVILAQYDDEGNKIKYSRAIEAHANFIWAWEHGDKEKESGVITIKQLKARSAKEYDFHLLKDFDVCTLRDYNGPPPMAEKENNKKDNKNKKKKTVKKENKSIDSNKDKEDKVDIEDTDKSKSIPRMPQLI